MRVQVMIKRKNNKEKIMRKDRESKKDLRTTVNVGSKPKIEVPTYSGSLNDEDSID